MENTSKLNWITLGEKRGLKAIHEHKEAVSDRHVFVPRVALTRVIGLGPRLIGSTDRRDFHSVRYVGSCRPWREGEPA